MSDENHKGQDMYAVSKRIKGFEDIIAWQKARVLSKEIYRLTQKKSFFEDFGLRDQMRRASISIMSNLAEGCERDTSAQFHHSIVIAKASCAELRSQLYSALDVGYLPDDEFRKASAFAIEVSRIIGALKKSIANRKSPR